MRMVFLVLIAKLFPYNLSSTVVYVALHGLLVFTLRVSHSPMSLQPGVLEHFIFIFLH